MTALPQEIVDHIIDLVQDTNTLRACSLACHSWAYRSRSQLHRRVRLNCQEDLKSGHYDTTAITQLTHQLILTFPTRPGFPTDVWWDVISKFTNVQRLTLREACWSYSDEEKLSFSSLFNRVTSLKLQRCQYQNLSNFLDFISVFPSLRELELDEITWDRDCDSEMLPSQLPGRGLRRLIIAGNGLAFVAPVGRWLKALQGDRLREFTLSWENTAPGGEKALKSLLESLSTCLVHLDINTEAFSMSELDRTCLETIVGLRTLTLGKLFLIEDYGPEVHPEIEQISNILSHSDLRGFSQLILSCVVAGRAIHSLFVIDNALSQKRFPGLSHVVIEVQDTLQRNGVHRKILDALPDRMPSLAARGILSMKCGTLSWMCKGRVQAS